LGVGLRVAAAGNADEQHSAPPGLPHGHDRIAREQRGVPGLAESLLLEEDRAQVSLKAKQVLQLLNEPGTFATKEGKREAFMVFFPRIVDNIEVKGKNLADDTALFPPLEPGVQSLFTQLDYEIIARRVGKAHFFNPLKCDSTKYNLDLKIHEERFIVRMIVLLSAKEDGQNLVECKFGSARDCATEFDIPAEWLKSVPLTGFFSATYQCEEKDQKIPFRKKLWATFWKWDA